MLADRAESVLDRCSVDRMPAHPCARPTRPSHLGKSNQALRPRIRIADACTGSGADGTGPQRSSFL